MHLGRQRDVKTINHHVVMEGGFRRDMPAWGSNSGSENAC
jgi:hypothetical protein